VAPAARSRQLAPLHPGEVLREEFLIPLGMSSGELARACGVPRTRIERLVNEQIGIAADTALRLGRAFGTSPEVWLNLQTDFDVQTAKRQIGKALDKIAPVPVKIAL
jgi:antitoxin HigA-1